MAAALAGSENLPPPVITYDVNCGFSIKINKRFEKNFPHLLATVKAATYCVPEFHIKGHKDDCQDRYSCRYTPGCGRTHAEGVEHLWSETNQAGISTREMNPGARHDALNDFIGFWNWRKVEKTSEHSFVILEGGY